MRRTRSLFSGPSLAVGADLAPTLTSSLMPSSLRLAAQDADDVSSASPSPRLQKKERGAFFTPQAIADYLAHWAVRRRTDRILDPTCGEAVFLASSGARLQHLGAAGDLENQLFGVDIHADTLARADQILRKQRLHAWIMQRNFLHL